MPSSKSLLSSFIFISILFLSCNSSKTPKEEDTRPYFEGEIKLSETRGLYGALTKVHTTYYISENKIKREQKWGGVYSVLDNYAGIIIDLEKDSVTMYYADKFSNVRNKHTLSIEKYKSYLVTKTIPNGIPSPVDHTFELLPEYKLIHQVKDSTVIQSFTSDFTRYHDDSDFLNQDVFDSKDIKVKRELLEMIFMNLPEEINFPLKSESKLTFSEISNDSIIKGKQTKALDQFARKLLRKKDSTIKKESDLEKLAKNKWLNFGLQILKKGVDLNIHVTTEVSEFSVRALLDVDVSMPSGDFVDVLDFDDFINDLPTGGGGDFDD
ncbi:hypothetical protein [Aquimarina litoralis]|uniref:hypothetical protein n=1 Tax=Aquimarina litoralis TaxID=584605 RepID=UPI001C592EE7|nr:hypothetical protein [Aquimarina litoralis]MBW1295923.1 hypothetical protein [Aquimarina litoralis]